jgi:hypothetical protein
MALEQIFPDEVRNVLPDQSLGEMIRIDESKTVHVRCSGGSFWNVMSFLEWRCGREPLSKTIPTSPHKNASELAKTSRFPRAESFPVLTFEHVPPLPNCMWADWFCAVVRTVPHRGLRSASPDPYT